MHTELCDRLGIEFPIFAFTHCRDVVVAVSQAGGFGVLGAVGFTPEQLEIECKWIDEHIGDKPYGVDIVIPNTDRTAVEDVDFEELQKKFEAMVPQELRDFAANVLKEHGVPELPPEEETHDLLGWTAATAAPQVEVALKHEKVRLLANALGTPPAWVVEQVHESGRLVAALCGKVRQAKRHAEAGIDIIIAQGTEGGGHTGEIGSVVLWPQIIDAVAPVPVLAAGGIGNGRQMAAALACGAQGVWTGSLWLTVEEAESAPAQKDSYLGATSEDTVRSRSFTGKPCRMLRNEWTDAWGQEDTPDPLGMPLQGMVSMDCIRRTSRYASTGEAQKVAFNPVGQVVGQMNQVRSSREVIQSLVEEYVDTLERMNALMPE